MDGFSKLVEDIWKDSPCVGNNVMSILMGKELEAIDLIIDKGQGNEDVIRSRADIMNQLHNCNKLDSMEAVTPPDGAWTEHVSGGVT
ncbi:hypothetical protein Tco_1242755 [Tanacetum coccineum]